MLSYAYAVSNKFFYTINKHHAWSMPSTLADAVNSAASSLLKYIYTFYTFCYNLSFGKYVILTFCGLLSGHLNFLMYIVHIMNMHDFISEKKKSKTSCLVNSFSWTKNCGLITELYMWWKWKFSEYNILHYIYWSM